MPSKKINVVFTLIIFISMVATFLTGCSAIDISELYKNNDESGKYLDIDFEDYYKNYYDSFGFDTEDGSNNGIIFVKQDNTYQFIKSKDLFNKESFETPEDYEKNHSELCVIQDSYTYVVFRAKKTLTLNKITAYLKGDEGTLKANVYLCPLSEFAFLEANSGGIDKKHPKCHFRTYNDLMYQTHTNSDGSIRYIGEEPDWIYQSTTDGGQTKIPLSYDDVDSQYLIKTFNCNVTSGWDVFFFEFDNQNIVVYDNQLIVFRFENNTGYGKDSGFNMQSFCMLNPYITARY